MQEMRDAYDLARETSVRVIQNSLDQRIPLVHQINFLRFFRFGIVFSYCIIKFIAHIFIFELLVFEKKQLRVCGAGVE